MAADQPTPGSQWSPADLLKYGSAIWRYRWLVVATALIGASFALWENLSAVPTYTASSRILIQRPNTSMSAFDQLLEGTGRRRAGVDPTQLQLLESRDFLVRVLARQDELVGRAERSLAATTDEQPTVRQGPASWFQSVRSRLRQLRSVVLIALRDFVSGPPPALMDPGLLDEELRDRRLASRVSGLRATMRVRAVSGTDIVTISWTSRDPVFATKMANLIAEEYVAYTVEAQTLLAEQATTFLTEEIGSLRNEVRDAEDEARSLAQTLGLDDPLDGASSSQSLAQLGTQYATARADRVQKESTLRQIEAATPSTVAEVRNHELVRQARTELARLETELEAESDRLTDAHPTIRQLRSNVADAEARLRSEESSAYDLALATASQAHRAAARYETRMQQMLNSERGTAAQMGEDYVRYQDLRSTAANKRDVLQQFLDRQEAAEIRSRVQGFQGASVRVVDRATLPRTPSGRRLSAQMLFAALVGGAMGAAIGLGLDLLDTTMRTAGDVSRRLGVEPLATTMDVRAAARSVGHRYGGYGSGYTAEPSGDPNAPPEFVTSDQPRSLLAEEYRELRTNLLLSTAGGAPRRILVTSTHPGEGKTSVSVNLAISLAQTGKRVLLIDGDMRKPRIADLFELENKDGLSTYLAGAIPWTDAVEDTRIPNLWVLPSGPVPPNPAELYAGTRDEELFTAALDRFDMVVCDAPPVLNVVDPLILAREVDGVIMIIKSGKTPHQGAARARQKILDVGGRLLGLVLTQTVPSSGRGYYARRYYRASAKSAAEDA